MMIKIRLQSVLMVWPMMMILGVNLWIFTRVEGFMSSAPIIRFNRNCCQKIGKSSAFPHTRSHLGSSSSPSSMSLKMVQSNNNNNRNNRFDVSKPVFDLLSFRSIRGDALVRYDALNQSEPLRIMIYALLCFLFLTAPTLGESLGYEDLTLPATIGSITCSVLSGGLFVRECQRRSNQLSRMEKELNTELLPIQLPTNALADRPLTKPITVKELRQNPRLSGSSSSNATPPRIIALCGNKQQLQQAMQGLVILGRRLQQASVYVVAVPTDGSKFTEWLVPSSTQMTRPQWLADPYNVKVWLEYFDSLSDNDKSTSSSTTGTTTFKWFGLNSNGRSFGSGEGDVPLWIQILGQYLRPTVLLDESDDNSSNTSIMTTDKETEKDKENSLLLLKSFDNFYKALTTGDQDAMTKIFSKTPSNQVSEVMDAGGRLDSWKDCLADGARPEGMKVSGTDWIIVSDTEAYTTTIEFPINNNLLDQATLLAIQKWTRTNPQQDDSSSWKLELHQTIPWSSEAKAQGTLRCDCRGCVALTRGPERRTFGGIIG